MLKPMDIHNLEFKRVFKGYDPEEVDDFLADIVVKYEAVYQENRKLRQELEELRKKEESQGSREQDVLDLLAMTKQAVQEMKTMANREADNVISVAQSEAERIISEARLKAQQILADAEERLQKTQRLERQLRERIRLTMETVWNSLTAEDGEATRPYKEIASVSAGQEEEAP
ncbi:MAG: DivIVA domain-containing protein [Firmicutes bacterium]|nr:DivIVA domain-containing protein [Bacillota bacterium]